MAGTEEHHLLQRSNTIGHPNYASIFQELEALAQSDSRYFDWDGELNIIELPDNTTDAVNAGLPVHNGRHVESYAANQKSLINGIFEQKDTSDGPTLYQKIQGHPVGSPERNALLQQLSADLKTRLCSSRTIFRSQSVTAASLDLNWFSRIRTR